MENAITTLLASQQLAATQQERLAGLQLHEQVCCYLPRLPTLAAALLLRPSEDSIAAMRLRLPVRRCRPAAAAAQGRRGARERGGCH